MAKAKKDPTEGFIVEWTGRSVVIRRDRKEACITGQFNAREIRYRIEDAFYHDRLSEETIAALITRALEMVPEWITSAPVRVCTRDDCGVLYMNAERGGRNYIDYHRYGVRTLFEFYLMVRRWLRDDRINLTEYLSLIRQARNEANFGQIVRFALRLELNLERGVRVVWQYAGAREYDSTRWHTDKEALLQELRSKERYDWDRLPTYELKRIRNQIAAIGRIPPPKRAERTPSSSRRQLDDDF